MSHRVRASLAQIEGAEASRRNLFQGNKVRRINWWGWGGGGELLRGGFGAELKFNCLQINPGI